MPRFMGDVNTTYAAALAIVNAYGSSGVPAASDPLVSAYQSSWNADGPSANDVLTVDGLYGPLTATALAATLSVYNSLNGTSYSAPAANSYASGGGSVQPTPTQQQTITQDAQSSQASFVDKIPGGWWTVGIVGALVVGGLGYEALKTHPMAQGPHKVNRQLHHHARRVTRHVSKHLTRRGRARRK